MIEEPIVEEMLEAGEMALDECEQSGCSKRETVAAIYAAMQTAGELFQQRARGLIN